jgi:Fe-S-cluster containining protein
VAAKSSKPQFDCMKCPAYCCSYEVIPVTMRDLRRLARRFDLTVEECERKFTKTTRDGKRVMRHRKDHVFPSTCRFLDQEDRTCTIYEDRPQICRDFPSTRRCGYFDFMMWEREQQGDDEFIPVVG